MDLGQHLAGIDVTYRALGLEPRPERTRRCVAGLRSNRAGAVVGDRAVTWLPAALVWLCTVGWIPLCSRRAAAVGGRPRSSSGPASSAPPCGPGTPSPSESGRCSLSRPARACRARRRGAARRAGHRTTRRRGRARPARDRVADRAPRAGHVGRAGGRRLNVAPGEFSAPDTAAAPQPLRHPARRRPVPGPVRPRRRRRGGAVRRCGPPGPRPERT